MSKSSANSIRVNRNAKKRSSNIDKSSGAKYFDKEAKHNKFEGIDQNEK